MFAGRRSVLSLAVLLCALSAFGQGGAVPMDHVRSVGDDALDLVREEPLSVPPILATLEDLPSHVAPTAQGVPEAQSLDSRAEETAGAFGDRPAENSKIQPTDLSVKALKPPDFNQEIYYRNKLEFSLEGGWLPINVPFPLDIFVGDAYNTYPLKYTLVPIFASLRWQINGLSGPWVLRGNWDLTFTGSITAVPRGPENHYLSYIMGIRRNFVHRNWRTAPYFDIRLGVGNIDAKGPKGVAYAQGQDLTFTVNMGSGVRYNLSPRFAISAGLNFMHISNLDLSQHPYQPTYPWWGFRNYGINVYGPMVGIDVQLRRHPHHSE